uniref:Intraflagellar transport protein 122 homolog n=1 Tax=Heterorhabditis bacteriophora TaxID=37862 RepID=A0A1I7X4W8_HETBA
MRSSGVCFCQLLVLTEADITSVRSTTPLFSNELQFRTTFTLNNDEAISVYDFLGDKYKIVSAVQDSGTEAAFWQVGQNSSACRTALVDIRCCLCVLKENRDLLRSIQWNA